MSYTPLQDSQTVETENSTYPTPPQREEKKEHPLTEIIRFSLIALIIVFPIRMFVAQPFIVSGASMLNTFHNGEYLIVDQLTYRFEEVERGDVVVFRYPRDPSKFFIKRIIGIPGDQLTIEGNQVTIKNDSIPNGTIINEPYVYAMEPNTFLEETLGDGEYFVMGDNRNQSSDSRMWGVLHERNIVGRALVRLFPISQAGLFPGSISSDEILQN